MSNEPAPAVRKRPAAARRRPRPDRRTLRTRRALGTALVDLMLAHDFADISVEQVLRRAKVGRATFYAHFRNKHDLLLGDAERFWEQLETRFLAHAAGSRRVAPVAELLAHAADYERFQRALARSALHETVYDLVAGLAARLIERRVATLHPNAAVAPLSGAATARVFAAALVEMMRWWLDQPARPTPRAMDDAFHAIVWGGLAHARPS